jgi:hypothetical protein
LLFNRGAEALQTEDTEMTPIYGGTERRKFFEMAFGHIKVFMQIYCRTILMKNDSVNHLILA